MGLQRKQWQRSQVHCAAGACQPFSLLSLAIKAEAAFLHVPELQMFQPRFPDVVRVLLIYNNSVSGAAAWAGRMPRLGKQVEEGQEGKKGDGKGSR